MTSPEVLQILEEMRDNQKTSLEIQREQFDFIKNHYDRAEAIQNKAEKIQDRASQVMKIILPVIVICILFLLGIALLTYL
jgi:phospholipid N-methyltransferase